MKRVDVASALIFDETKEKIVMVNNKSGNACYWSLPGGAVEAGETLEQAVIRETKEESGLEIEIIGLHSVREALFADASHHALLFTFLAKAVGGQLKASDPDDEIVDVQWVDIHTANERLSNLLVKMSIRSEDSWIPYSFHGVVR